MTLNLHIGSGTVYLKNFVNIDLPSDNCFLSHERTDLVDKFITTADKYYDRHKDQDINRFKSGTQKVETVCDRYGSFQNIPARNCTVNSILCRQVWEHQSINEAIVALKECHRVLLPGGYLTIDVPDTEMSIRMYGETKDQFYIRHIIGPINKGSWGHHIMSYSEPELANLVESQNFLFYCAESNIHCYPAICLTFQKK